MAAAPMTAAAGQPTTIGEHRRHRLSGERRCGCAERQPAAHVELNRLYGATCVQNNGVSPHASVTSATT
jgi:hypothetical protein